VHGAGAEAFGQPALLQGGVIRVGFHGGSLPARL
jgi:hypothetical protein